MSPNYKLETQGMFYERSLFRPQRSSAQHVGLTSSKKKKKTALKYVPPF